MNNSTKFFFNRCNELLHRNSFDTYRVSLHTPVTIFKELESSIQKYNSKLIKHFAPSITSIVEEATCLINNSNLEGVINLGDFNIKQIKKILSDNSKGDNSLRSLNLLARSFISANSSFKDRLFDAIKEILIGDLERKKEKLNCLCSWLMSELLYKGYSRSFIKDRLYRFSKYPQRGESLEDAINKLIETFNHDAETYGIIYKIKHSNKETFKTASSSVVTLDEFPEEYIPRVNRTFKTLKPDEFFLSVSIDSYDFKQALKTSYISISEVIDINALHQSDFSLKLDSQAFVFHMGSRRSRTLPLEEYLDGYYDYQEDEFERFILNYSSVEESTSMREKLRSAIRFYKLGNESVELEHKILNYWIGFEQLYSSENSNEDSIKRIKVFYPAINGTFYLQRRLNYLVNSLNRAGITYQGNLITKEILFNKNVVEVLEELTFDNPLMKFRIKKYLAVLFNKKELRSSLEKHTQRLQQHLTRIYRIRNEIVHEGNTSLELELIAGHLRHYLLFSIEQITHELSENELLDSLDDVFVYFENIFAQVKESENIRAVFDIKNYKGYME